MWAMLQAAGAALGKIGAKHPALKWGVVALVGLLAVELVAREGIAVWHDWNEARKVKAQSDAATAKPLQSWLPNEIKPVEPSTVKITPTEQRGPLIGPDPYRN
jgi:hypothetical protein